MGNDAGVKQLTASGTTTLGSVFLYNICVNKTLTGTITINEGANTVGILDIGTLAGNYHQHSFGTRYYSLSIVLSAADDASVLTRFTS
jgi:hypothetical protein